MHHIITELARYCSCSASDIRVDRCHGGDIHNAFRVKTPRGVYFLKQNDATFKHIFIREALDLDRISHLQYIRVPRVIHVCTEDSWSGILLEYIELYQDGDSAQAAKGLVELHTLTSNTGSFGDTSNGYIGHLEQSNTEHPLWSHFWIQERLYPLWRSLPKIEPETPLCSATVAVIEDLLTHELTPSLLHGDLWGGNKAFDRKGVFVLYDPSSYFGDPEVDLAMASLFGGFSSRFFASYMQLHPLPDGWEERRMIYQLYYLLCHWKHFGGSYRQQSIGIMQSIASLHRPYNR